MAALFALLLLIVGLLRLQFSADIFGLLPADLPVIKALADYQKGFKREQEIQLLLTAPQRRQAESAAADLASSLKQQGLVAEAIWQNPAEQNTEVLAELLALQWINLPTEKMQALAESLQADRALATLQQRLEDSYQAMDPFEAAMGLSDPFGLAELSSQDSLENSSNLVASDDGRMRVLYLSPAADQADLSAWVLNLKSFLASWQQQFPELQIGLSGTPVFNQEFSSSLSGDMQKAVLATLVLVALLFAWAHRRLAPLLWLVSLLALVLLSTVAIGGQLLGALNIISLGYAAVLMGLAADYGLLLYQAHRSSQQPIVATVKQVAPSILWAALTTSVAFLMVARGSLPGMAQLGLLVALGIVLAAVFMLALYLWPLSNQASQLSSAPKLLLPRNAAGLTMALLMVSLLTLLWRLPSLNTDPAALGPKALPANDVQEQINQALRRDAESLFILFSAAPDESPAAVQSAIDNSRPILDAALEQGLLSSYALPKWWPNADQQRHNRGLMQSLSAAWPQLMSEAEALGYPVENMGLSHAVMRQFGQLAIRQGLALPQLSDSAWLFSQTAAINESIDSGLRGYFAVAQLTLSQGVSKADRNDLVGKIDAIAHAKMAGWPLASAGLLATMQGDFIKVALPMLALLLLVLLLAFRGIKEVVFCLAAMLLTLLCLSALMAALGWQWNLMNMLALPLLVGITVDYSIHTQLALQRFQGDLAKVYNHVGRAIALAGATTAIGFGSLVFANSEGLAGLGKVAASGVVLACFISVLLQPHWWRLMQTRQSHN